jgi:integrative and conjugative element protein (TIGR02256 family)
MPGMFGRMRPTIVLPGGLIDDLNARRLSRLPRETGGFLLGERRGHHLDVTGATDQAPEDVATTASFERRDPAHGDAAIAEWNSSGGLISIVGDWHSHPHGPPEHSSTDKKAWRQLCRVTGGGCIGIILGDREAGVYLIGTSLLRTHIVRLTPVEMTPHGVAYWEAR